MLQQNRLWLILRTGWRFAGNYRIAMLACTALFMLAQAIGLLEPYIIGLMLNAVQSDLSIGAAAHLLHDVIWYSALFFLIKLGFWSIHGPTRLLERYIAFQICFAYKAYLFQCVTQLPLKWQRQHHSGESIDKINRATNALSDFFQGTFDLIYMVCRLFGTLIILQFFMPSAALAVIVTTVLSLLTIIKFDNVLSRQYDELNKMANFIAEAIHDYVTNIVTVITLRLQGRTRDEVRRRMMLPLSLYKKNNFLNESKWFLTAMLITLMTVVVLIGYTYSTLSAGGVLLAGTFFTLFDYLRRIGDSFYNFASQYGRVVRQAADIKAAESIFKEFEGHPAEPADAVLPEDWKKVSVRGLNFTYDQAEQEHRQHLKDVSIDLERGKAIAVVGQSGSGKSTLLRVLRGLDTAGDSQASVDGVDLPHKLKHLASTTTLMPQDPEIFADTIRFNIAFGMETDEEEIMKAVRAARFDEVLARLPHGLETNIAEKGINLSGGEKQRLAFARGIFFARDSQILLLDEPTSSVDTANERMIYTNLLNGFRDRCLVSTIHKLHLLELFDKVYVLHDGRLVESGTFHELVTAGGKLAVLWKNYQAAAANTNNSAQSQAQK